MMKLAGYYIRLYDRFHPESGDRRAEVQVDEIAELLECTHRNVLLILKRMTDRGWIRWTPRRGRGHRSELAFLSQRDDLILELARQMLAANDLRGALDHIREAVLPEAIKAQFYDGLFEHFGCRTEIRGDQKYDTLRIPLVQPFETLDPLRADSPVECRLVHQLFDGLVRYDPAEQRIKPRLAHAWECHANRRQWVFHLRKGVLFHHGRELTAADVAFTLDRLRHAPTHALYHWGYEQMEDIEIADPNTLRIRLSEPNELFLPLLGARQASIVPRDIGEQDQERLARFPVGTGPFKLSSNDGSLCVLEAFPFYFQGRAHLDKVEIWNVPDLSGPKYAKRLEAVQTMPRARISGASPAWGTSGALSISGASPVSGASGASGASPISEIPATSETPPPGRNSTQPQGGACVCLALNLVKPGPLLFPPLREALCRAINRRAVMEQTGGEAIHPTKGFVSAGEEHDPPFDPEQAAARLKQAGYRGETLELCAVRQCEDAARVVEEVCEQAGIRLRLRLLSPDEFRGEQRLKADLLLFAVMLDDDLELRLLDLYKSMRQHLGNDLNAYIEGPLRQILKQPDKPARTSLFREVESFLKGRCALLFLYRKQENNAQPDAQGLSLDAHGWARLKDIWLAT